MKKSLENFYDNNKSVFEIAGMLLVITGLILNVPTTYGWIDKSLSQLKFLLLLGSDVIIIYLLGIALQSFLHPFLDNKEDVGADYTGQEKNIKFLLKKILVTTFFVLIAFLFAFNLGIYLILSYKRESIFLAITILCYLFIFKFGDLMRPLPKNWRFHMWAIVFLLFFIGAPIISYLFLYFNLPITIYYLGTFIMIGLLMSIVGYLLLLMLLENKSVQNPG